MKSKHLEGRAVDLMAYIGSRASWELNLYDDIADAMAIASRDIGLPVTWGAAWHIPDIGQFDGTMEQAMNEYVDSASITRQAAVFGWAAFSGLIVQAGWVEIVAVAQPTSDNHTEPCSAPPAAIILPVSDVAVKRSLYPRQV
jgi:hypothetical protein